MNIRSLTAMAAAAAALTIAAQARADEIFYLTQPECTGGSPCTTLPALLSNSLAVQVDVHLVSSTSATVTFTNYNSGNIGTPVELNVAGSFQASSTEPLAPSSPCGNYVGAPAQCSPGSDDHYGTMDLITSAVGAQTFVINLTAENGTTWATEAAVLTPTTGYDPIYGHGFEAEVAHGSNGVQDAGSVAVPAPSIGHGLPGILAVAGVLFGAGLMARGKKRGCFGVPRAG